MTIRTRLPLPSAALLLAVPALAACGGSDAPEVTAPSDTSSDSTPAPAPSSADAPTSSAPAPSASEAAPTTPSAASSSPAPGASTPAPTGGGDAAQGKGGAASAELAAQEFIRGMGSLKTQRSCAVATTDDGKKPLLSDPAQFKLCVAGLKQAANQAPKAQRSGLAKAVVRKVKTTGDRATVRPQDVTVGQGQASNGTGTIDCRRIGGRWYVDVSTLGS
jgi:hypothetical protein